MTDWSEPLFLIGPGYSGHALARIWRGPVYGTVRSETAREKLAGTTITPVDVQDAKQIAKCTNAAHVVISAPPTDAGCPAVELLGAHANQAASVTYLSTTGVYGDLQGGWAMEWTLPNPQSDRARRRVAAEAAWQDATERLRIVRLPGIYGPGRSALDRVRKGTARRIIRDGQVFSRAHVDDIASGVRALARARRYGVFNLCDDEAAPPQDVIAHAAHLLGQPVPPDIPFGAAELSEMGRSFYSECKRVSNAKIKAATGWRPLYPTFREGLKALLES
ncbi:MAG: SDR family NAD(P)-dependent oxidoreductase [Pseudomonadota bacterium]